MIPRNALFICAEEVVEREISWRGIVFASMGNYIDIRKSEKAGRWFEKWVTLEITLPLQGRKCMADHENAANKKQQNSIMSWIWGKGINKNVMAYHALLIMQMHSVVAWKYETYDFWISNST